MHPAEFPHELPRQKAVEYFGEVFKRLTYTVREVRRLPGCEDASKAFFDKYSDIPKNTSSLCVKVQPARDA